MTKPSYSPPKSPRLFLIGVGTILSSMVLGGFLLGYWVDGWLDTKPVFMLLFAGLGFVGGTIRVYKLLVN
ncbi:MAG: AtpZ/AtpI family protein [Chromatiales bacterium]|nr:AtpZ/AtpI family protein [Chromatiales bacterium]